jgi:hypothetical protein
MIKRAWYGTYHHWSQKCLHRYVDEACFRQNNRSNAAAFDTIFSLDFLLAYRYFAWNYYLMAGMLAEWAEPGQCCLLGLPFQKFY